MFFSFCLLVASFKTSLLQNELPTEQQQKEIAEVKIYLPNLSFRNLKIILSTSGAISQHPPYFDLQAP